MRLPRPRGPISAAVVHSLAGHASDSMAGLAIPVAGAPVRNVADDEDLQLALFVCYELHYRGFDAVDEEREWDPELIALRARLEDTFEQDLRARFQSDDVATDDIPLALTAVTTRDYGPPLAGYLQRHATYAQFREFVIHRSLYHLKEADPHTWAIPRLAGAVKAALVEIQIDEYGRGQEERMHSSLFRATMRALDLDDSYGHYLDSVPAITLATSNVISLFGLHRRLRGALVGHLAAFEMTSSLPNRRYGNGLRRLGGSTTDTAFYDEHVTADAVHEQIAAHDLCGGLALQEPQLRQDILFGATCCLALDGLAAQHLMDAWEQGQSSLRQSAPALDQTALAG